jgi:hypothetical protein
MVASVGDVTLDPSSSQLFTVRVWKAPIDGGFEYRGSVHEVATGAFRNFRSWRDLTEFIVARIDELTYNVGGRRQGGK